MQDEKKNDIETAAGDVYHPADSLGLTTQIATGQTARLNLLNPLVQPTATAAASCSAAMAFDDAAGAVIQSSTVSVQPGESLPYDLVWSDSRAEIRATVEVPLVVPPAGSAIPIAWPCNLIPTLESFDTNRGRTDLIIGASHLVSVPPPLPTTA